MNIQKLSVNRSFFLISFLFAAVSASVLAVFYFFTRNEAIIALGLILFLILLFCNIFFVMTVRKKLILFSDAICGILDDMTDGKAELSMVGVAGENMFYKIIHRMNRLHETILGQRFQLVKEREELQELVSDISHQVKTPIANLKLIDTTLLEQSVSTEEQRHFLTAMDGQIDKLDFLMQAMIKTSRLESGIISMEKKMQPVYDTIAAALGSILLQAEKKEIQVTVSCPKELEAAHDRKWTSEALFNLLDNAVKYTRTGGRIHVLVERWEMYLKIDIEDNGKGIAEERQGTVFKRFYREKEVHDEEGIGIGLYLARKMITMQGGYIKLSSRPGEGSVFSVFLPV